MKKATCLMLMLMALTVFLVFTSQSAAEEGDTTVGTDNEIVRQVPQAVHLTEDETGDDGPVVNSAE